LSTWIKCRYLGTGLKEYSGSVEEGIGSAPDPFKNTYAGLILGSEKFMKDTVEEMRMDVESGDYA
jgi:hypothetical protein